MPVYPIHPCCYCGKTEAGQSCRMSEKVDCYKFLGYLQKLNSMNAQTIIIKELKYLLATNIGGK